MAAGDVLATATVRLRIPKAKAEAWLKGTPHEGANLAELPDRDRAPVADIIEKRVDEDLGFLLDHAEGEADVEADW